MRKALPVVALALVASFAAMSGRSDASVIFAFAEVGGTVTMTSSGTLDTTKLAPSSYDTLFWGGTGTEDNGNTDIMGSTLFGQVDTAFGFNAGTNTSAFSSAGGPFSFSSFPAITVTGSTSFATYRGFQFGVQQPGISMRAADIAAGLWTPDQSWTYQPGTTFASLGLIAGTYTVSDSRTGESITIQIGDAGPPVPEPATLSLLGLGLAGAGARRWRQRKQQ